MQAGGEVGPDEAGMAVHLGGELGEALLGERVTVDADQRAGRPDPLGDQARVTAAAERAIDRDLAGLRIEQVDQLAGEDRDMGAGHVK